MTGVVKEASETQFQDARLGDFGARACCTKGDGQLLRLGRDAKGVFEACVIGRRVDQMTKGSLVYASEPLENRRVDHCDFVRVEPLETVDCIPNDLGLGDGHNLVVGQRLADVIIDVLRSLIQVHG